MAVVAERRFVLLCLPLGYRLCLGYGDDRGERKDFDDFRHWLESEAAAQA